MSNIIFIEFFNKQNFPEGKWSSEPDLCSWVNKLPCLAIRDMTTGVWKGYVGIESSHPFHGLSLTELLRYRSAQEIFISVYGGISWAGKLPSKFKDHAKNLWFLSVETSYNDDAMPLIKLESENILELEEEFVIQTYKDLHFIRRETNKLANHLSKITCL